MNHRMLGLLLGFLLCGLLLLSSCSLPQVTAEDRIFLPLALEFLGDYRLSETNFEGPRVGGLSALAYDRAQDRFYALSDDQSNQAPARFYTLALDLDSTPRLQRVTVTGVTVLKTDRGTPYPPKGINPEGLALSPNRALFIASEGLTRQGIPPLLGKFDRETGILQQTLKLPDTYLPNGSGAEQQQGVADNLGFESLTLNPEGDRLFTLTETALIQDFDPEDATLRSRFLHYWVGEPEPVIISEHLYPVEPAPPGTLINGAVELVALDSGGHFLGLERAYTPLVGRYGAQIFQLATGGATDTTKIASFRGPLRGVQPIRKQLLLDLGELGIPLENLEGMAWGPRLPDGSQSLLLVSNNNFDASRSTQFLLFRLTSP